MCLSDYIATLRARNVPLLLLRLSAAGGACCEWGKE